MKALVIIFLALAIFGGAYYATWLLYLKPQQAIRAEQLAPPPPPPPDPALPDFEKVVALQQSGDTLAERTGWQEFLERFPRSSKSDEARDRLGQINSSLYLSPILTPEKSIYLVKPGDVINKVANRSKTTPELLMRSNNLQGTMLRIGQKLIVAPADFALSIQSKGQKVILLQQGKFFKQYPILAMPAHHAATAAIDKKAPAKPIKLAGRITEKIAWHNGTRVTFSDKSYPESTHWIIITPGGHNLYTEMETPPGGEPLQKPPGGGYGLAPESLSELSVLLRKNDAVTIE